MDILAGQKITFITALIRPQNLALLQASIFGNLLGKVTWDWWIVVDANVVPSLRVVPPVHAHLIYSQLPIRTYGFLEKNLAIDRIEENNWIYFLDDDTELHPKFIEEFGRGLVQKPEALGMVFSQELPDGSIRNTPAGLDNYLTKIDMCQYILKRSAIAYHRFLGVFGADGELFNRVYRENTDRFVFSDGVGAHHNNLRKGEPWTPETGYGRAY